MRLRKLGGGATKRAVSLEEPVSVYRNKKLKAGPPIYLLSMTWVHPDLQTDVLKQQEIGGEVNGCFNWYVRLGAWVQLVIEPEE